MWEWWWVHFYVFTHFLKSLVMGAIIFSWSLFLDVVQFFVDPIAKETWVLLGWNYFSGGPFSNTFFFCWISCLQYVFLYIIWFLILFDCLVYRKLFWIHPVKTGKHFYYHYHWIITTRHVIFQFLWWYTRERNSR